MCGICPVRLRMPVRMPLGSQHALNTGLGKQLGTDCSGGTDVRAARFAEACLCSVPDERLMEEVEDVCV